MQSQAGSGLQTPKRTWEEVQEIPEGQCLEAGSTMCSADPLGFLPDAGMELQWGLQPTLEVWAKYHNVSSLPCALFPGP